jgi:hypothetical protein
MSKFENGVPKVQVRELSEVEKKWDFWTTSSAFYRQTPKTRGFVQVPLGEIWIVEKFGSYSRTLSHGNHFILPFVESVKAVKLDTLNSMGVFGRGENSDAYCVAYYKVVDPSKVIYLLKSLFIISMLKLINQTRNALLHCTQKRNYPL